MKQRPNKVINNKNTILLRTLRYDREIKMDLVSSDFFTKNEHRNAVSIKSNGTGALIHILFLLTTLIHHVFNQFRFQLGIV